MNNNAHSETNKNTGAGLQNVLGDKMFYLKDPRTHEVIELGFAWNCSEDLIIFGQMLLLRGPALRGYADSKNTIVPSSLSAVRSSAASVRFICEYLHRECDGRKLSSFNIQEVRVMVQAFMVYGTDSTLGRSMLNSFCAILNDTYKMKNSGELMDGINFFINKGFKKDTMAPIMELFGLDYAEWYKGGSYGSIPMVCSSIILSEAIAILESDDLKIAQAFFETFKVYPKSPTKWFSEGTNSYDILAKYHEWVNHGLPVTYDRLTIVRFNILASRIRDKGVVVPAKLPWPNLRAFGNYCELAMEASLAVFLLLSGFRVGELEPLNVGDYYKKADGSWWFNTENRKTESGSVLARPLHGLVAKAADVNVSLCAVDAREYNLPLFHRGFKGRIYDVVLGWGGWKMEDWLKEARYSKQSLSYWFNNFYQKHVLPKHPELSAVHQRIHPHQARHTFAEFALRRFDSNVMEPLREHYRHALGSYQMRRYTDGKLRETVTQKMEADYLREIINRVASGNMDDRFHGPAANRIRKDVRSFNVVTPNELDNFIEQYGSNYERFVAFPWGYCALRVNEEHLAKCFDADVQTPKVDVDSCPEVCVGCPHNMSNDEQNRYLERIAIAHQDIAERHPLRFAAKMSEEVVKVISRRLEALE